MNTNFEEFEKTDKKLDAFFKMGLTSAGIVMAAIPFVTQNAVTVPNLIMGVSAAVFLATNAKGMYDIEKMRNTEGFNEYENHKSVKEINAQMANPQHSFSDTIKETISSIREKKFGSKDNKNKLDM